MFSYLSPLLYPLTGAGNSTLKVALDLPRICASRMTTDYSGKLMIGWVKVQDGEIIQSESTNFRVENGNVGKNFFLLEVHNDALGYIEIHITAETAAFTAIDVSAGYAFFNCNVNGVVNVNADAKYARPLVIEQIRHTGAFCLSHSNCYKDQSRGLGTKFLFVNPYSKALKAKIENCLEQSLNVHVKSKTAVLVNLCDLIEDRVPSTCMVVSKNRHPAWVVHTNHGLNSLSSVNRVDHLELFRAETSHENPSPKKLLKRLVQRVDPLRF